jgi:hypothetical protein
MPVKETRQRYDPLENRLKNAELSDSFLVTDAFGLG